MSTKYLIIPAVLFVGIVAWAVLRNGATDAIDARNDLVAEAPLYVEMVQPGTGDRIASFTILSGGRWTSIGRLHDGFAQRTAFDGRRQLVEAQPECFIERDAVPLPRIPGVVLAPVLDESVGYAFNPDRGVAAYTVHREPEVPNPLRPGLEQVDVVEDLTRLAEGWLSATIEFWDWDLTARQTFHLRRATEPEVAAAAALVAREPSRVAEVVLRARQGPDTTYLVPEDCPDSLVHPSGGRGSSFPVAASEGDAYLIDAADFESVPLDTSGRDMQLARAGRMPETLAIRPGLRFAHLPEPGTIPTLFEVVACEPQPWFPCRDGDEP